MPRIPDDMLCFTRGGVDYARIRHLATLLDRRTGSVLHHSTSLAKSRDLAALEAELWQLVQPMADNLWRWDRHKLELQGIVEALGLKNVTHGRDGTA